MLPLTQVFFDLALNRIIHVTHAILHIFHLTVEFCNNKECLDTIIKHS